MWHAKTAPRRAPGSTIQWKDPNVKQKEAVQAKKKPSIDWKDAPEGYTCARQVYPERYREPPNLDPKIAERFVIGAPVMAARALALSPRRGVYEFAPLEPFYGSPDEAHIPMGALLIYAGPVYEMERKVIERRKLDVAAVKHTFITPLGRCIIHDFGLIKLL